MTRAALLFVAAAILAGCGGAKKAATTTAAPATTTRPAAATTVTTQTGPGALQAEPASAAAGDIPDNQVFVRYTGGAFSIKYPEGWAQTGAARNVTFRDKNNIVRIVVVGGAPPTVASVHKELVAQKGARVQQPPQLLRIGGIRTVKAVYTTTSAPNPVTGKRVTLMVDRYELGAHGRRAIVDLGTPVGVDNVDAYRLMIESFRLR